MNRPLRLVADLHLPWIILKNNSSQQCYGILCNLVTYLATSLNFTYHIFQSGFGDSGYQLANGTWTGLVGSIVRDEADMTASPFPVILKPFAAGLVDYTHDYHVDDALILIRFDDSSESLDFHIFAILDKASYLTFLGLIVLVFSLIYGFRNQVQCKMMGTTDIIIQIVGPIIWADARLLDHWRVTAGTYLLWTSWLLCVLQISLLISSEITVRMSISFPRQQIDTVEEIVTSNMNLVVTPSFIWLQNTSNEAIYQVVVDKATRDDTIRSITSILGDKQWLLDTSEGKSAIFLPEVPLRIMPVLHSRWLADNAKFRLVKDKYGDPFHLAFAMSTKLSKQVRDQMSVRVCRYMASDIFHRQMQTLLRDGDRFFDTKRSVSNTFDQMSVRSLTGVFKLVLIAWGTCVLLAVTEISGKKLLSNKRFSSHFQS